MYIKFMNKCMSKYYKKLKYIILQKTIIFLLNQHYQ